MKLFGENKKSHILATSFKALYTLHHTMFAMIYLTAASQNKQQIFSYE